MKKEWKYPQGIVQEFAANEYVAACENGTTYWFECNAGMEYDNGIDGRGEIYVDSNNNGIKDEGDIHISDFHPCGVKHEVTKEPGEFSYGFYIPYVEDDAVKNVIIWQGDGDVHCSYKLNQDSWEVARS